MTIGTRWWGRAVLAAAACAAAMVVSSPVASAAPPAAVPAQVVTAPAQPRGAPPDTAAQSPEERARAAARAARREAQLASAGQRATATWAARGRPGKMVVVRTTTVDLVSNGRLIRRAPRPAGALTLPALAQRLPDSWLSISGGTARLSAAVVLTPGTTLDVGGAVTQLQLAGGDRLSDAASLYTGSGRLVLRGVTVASADRAFAGPMPPAPGRPFVVVNPGGRLETTDATLRDLGTVLGGEDDRPGVQLNAGSSGALVRTTVERASGALRLAGTVGVRLQDVTVTGSGGDGLHLLDDRGTTLSGVRAVGNRDNGVLVQDATADHRITGITTSGNGRYGLSVVRSTGTQVSGVNLSGDAAGGLRLYRTTGVTVTDLTATDQPIGVYTHGNVTDTVLERLAVTGGRRGVALEKSTTRLTLRNSTIDGPSVAGVAVTGSAIDLRDVAVSDSRTDIRIERGASGVTATGVQVIGGEDGVVVSPGTTGIVLDGLTASAIENDAVRSFGPDTRIIGGSITGATTGIHLAAPATISGTDIALVNNGIRTRSPGPVRAVDVDVDAVEVGIDAGANSPLVISGSRVRALESVRGELTESGANDIGLPPLNLIGAIGLPLVLLAVVLQLVHVVRQRRSGERTHRRVSAPVLATR